MINILKKYNQVFAGLIFLFYFLYTLNNALYISDYVMYSILLTFFIYFQTVFTFLYFYNKYGKPRLQDWMRLAIFFMLILNFMEIVNNSNGLSEIEFVVGKLSLDNSPFAMFIIILTLITLDFAYILYKSIKSKNYVVDDEVLFINKKYLVFSFLILTTIFQAYLLFSGITGFGSSLNSNSGGLSFIRMLSEYLSPFALIISSYIIFIENNTTKQYKLIFFSCLTFQILVGFLSGMKENALEPILYTLIVFLIAGKKIPKKLLTIGIFIIILLYPINNSYRNVIKDPFLNTGSNITNMAIAINQIIIKPISETLLSGVESYGDRSSMFPFLLYAIENEYKWTYYKNMNRYIYLPISWFVPRALLESKPKADIGGVLYAQLTGVRTTTAITVTNIGWAYLEGGVPYVFVIFLLIGFLMEYIEKKNIAKPIVLLFYVIMIHKAIKPEWDPYFMMSSLVPMFIIYWLLLKIVGMRRVRL